MNLEPQSELQKMWRWCHQRGDCMVQDFTELEYVYNLMKECKPESYLEIGTAEGDTLLMLGSTLPETGRIHWIDKGEPQFEEKRNQVVCRLIPRIITCYRGLSTDEECRPPSKEENPFRPDWDVVLIDGGHDYETVLSDSRRFAPLAKKYVFWHDVQIPDVKRAVHDCLQDNRRGEYSEFICSETMGFGVLKI